MGLLDTVKNAGIKTKCKADIALLEREMTTRKKQFGVDLYDLMAKLHPVTHLNTASINPASVFHPTQSLFEEDWKLAHREIQELTKNKEAKQTEIFRLEAKNECALPAISAGEKIKQAGQWMTDQGSTGKLMAEMASLDRNIRLRKEQFGIEIFDAVVLLGEKSSMLAENSSRNKSTTPLKKGFGGLKKVVSKQLSAVSSSEKEIEGLIQLAKQDAAYIQKNIERKEKEIASL